MPSYTDVQSAFLGELRHIAEAGTEISVRGSRTRETRARSLELIDVRERYVVLEGRRNNVFASIAESMWVLAGRNDLAYLTNYLPRAPEFSDDGVTWRAGYGPRLRSWNGLDQLAEVRRILAAELASRRAVITLFDPDRDFIQSRDIPCNNWLHFIARDGVLDLHVAARSTDIWWGFSGINAFEWTLLLEMMAFWLDQRPGRLVFFTSSMHLYERHFARAEQLLERSTTARASAGTRPAFATSWDAFSGEVQEWMRAERAMRTGSALADTDCQLSDPLLRSYARMIDVYWANRRGDPSGDIGARLAAVGDDRLIEAATEFISRTPPSEPPSGAGLPESSGA